jgi:hypothetical protein
MSRGITRLQKTGRKLALQPEESCHVASTDPIDYREPSTTYRREHDDGV